MSGLLKNPYCRYLIPFVVFIAIGYGQTMAPGPDAGWLIYAVKMAVTSTLLWFFFRKHHDEISGGFDWKAVATGLVVMLVWIVYYSMYPSGSSDSLGLTNLPLTAVIVFKLAGAVLVIPLLEELVFRSFLMRAFINEKFLTVPVGSYTALSFWVSAVIFGLMHPQNLWGVAIFAGVAYGFYLIKTKNLKGAMIAHATTNFGLWVYVVLLHKWGLWA